MWCDDRRQERRRGRHYRTSPNTARVGEAEVAGCGWQRRQVDARQTHWHTHSQPSQSGLWYGRDGPTYIQPAMAAGTPSAHARMDAHGGEGGRRGVALRVWLGCERDHFSIVAICNFGTDSLRSDFTHTHSFNTANTATELMASFQLCGHSGDQKL